MLLTVTHLIVTPLLVVCLTAMLLTNTPLTVILWTVRSFPSKLSTLTPWTAALFDGYTFNGYITHLTVALVRAILNGHTVDGYTFNRYTLDSETLTVALFDGYTVLATKILTVALVTATFYT